MPVRSAPRSYEGTARPAGSWDRVSALRGSMMALPPGSGTGITHSIALVGPGHRRPSPRILCPERARGARWRAEPTAPHRIRDDRVAALHARFPCAEPGTDLLACPHDACRWD